MALLSEIAVSGFTGMAPTPVNLHAINNYLLYDEFMNIMQFQNIGFGTNIGNMQATFHYYNGTGAAAVFRRIGTDYAVDNEEAVPETVALKLLGGAFSSDRAIERSFSQNSGALTNWVEQQLQQKLNKITNGFVANFLKGVAATNPLAFDGIGVFFRKFTGQVNTTPFNVPVINAETTLQVERHINTSVNSIRPGVPNLILTTVTGKTMLQTMNSYRRRNLEQVTIGSLRYNQYSDINIIALEDSYFEAADLAIGIPVILMKVDIATGVHTAVPMDGRVIDILMPNFTNGKFVEQGGAEMICAPLFVNPFCAAKCYITEEPAEG